MEWIKVSDRFPDIEGQEVIVCDEYKNVYTDFYYYNSDGFVNMNYQEIYNITHWMPLPKPPTE